MNRRLFSVVFAVTILGATALQAEAQGPSRIAFGSCRYALEPHPVLDVAAELNPGLFLFLGDNIYADTTDPAEIRAHYARLAESPSYQRLVRSTRVEAVWDDHDYGRNDAGARFPAREASEAIFEEFWGTAPAPRGQVPGVYGSFSLSVAGADAACQGSPPVRVILLDTRYFRSPLRRGAASTPDKGPYVQNRDPDATILGDAQWRWLENQMERPASLRIIVSSIQVLAEHHGYESWANFPHEQRRLLQLVYDSGPERTVFLSGDRHFAEFSAAVLERDGGRAPVGSQEGPVVYDITSSAINRRYPLDSPTDNRFRIGEAFLGFNVGQLVLEATEDGEVENLEVEIIDQDGTPVRSLSVSLNG